MSSRPIVIIGAGLTGLACARELGQHALVLEQEAEVGGLARSFTRGRYIFDMTGHWLHCRDPHVERFVHELLAGQWVRLARRAAIYSQGVTTPYPFQANTYGRPPAVIAECLLGYFRAREQAQQTCQPELRSFADYIAHKLGHGFARHFMTPYNTKLWTVPPSALDYRWCERFVPNPAPEEVLKGALEPAGAGHGLGYNPFFWYPAQGGIGQLAQRLRHDLVGAGEIRTGTSVAQIDWKKRLVTTANGEHINYNALVSTAPLDDLVRMLVDPPEAVAAAAQKLRSASVTYWDIGLARANKPDDAHWTYYADPDVPFYRVGSPSAVMPALAHGGRSLCVEVSHPRGTTAPVSDTEIIVGLRAVGLIDAGEMPELCVRSTIACAYVIMDHAYGTARATIRDWLTGVRIVSVGRYGSWTYDSMEGALVQGRQTADDVRVWTR